MVNKSEGIIDPQKISNEEQSLSTADQYRERRYCGGRDNTQDKVVSSQHFVVKNCGEIICYFTMTSDSLQFTVPYPIISILNFLECIILS